MTPEELLEQFRKDLANAVTLITNAAAGRPIAIGPTTPVPASSDELKKTAKILAHRDDQIVTFVRSELLTFVREELRLELRTELQAAEGRLSAQIREVREDTQKSALQRGIAANAAVAAANEGVSTNKTLSKQQQQLYGAIIVPSLIAILGALLNFARAAPAPPPAPKVEVVVPGPVLSATVDAGVHR